MRGTHRRLGVLRRPARQDLPAVPDDLHAQ
jgi:hypothetical protein